METIHEKIAKDAGIKTCMVVCDTCGVSTEVVGAYCLRYGWPECHNQTMRLFTPSAPKERTE